ncbi:YlxR family protein [Metamycoplasma hominis]|uniref:YlxR family protein n=1 Tax=Metamycoplasma hominis TaxID=2098 RepID=UPI00158A5829|nr:YlxR family protein [Metamycoplasma hominis]QKX31671.1 YlxR family protein [Metamycoplasma hominis]
MVKSIQRKSIVDNKIYDIDLLLRFSKDKNNLISFDPYKKNPGRGAYCLNDSEQIEILFKRRLLNKAFKQNIDIQKYNEIRKEVDEWVNKISKNENQTLAR